MSQGKMVNHGASCWVYSDTPELTDAERADIWQECAMQLYQLAFDADEFEARRIYLEASEQVREAVTGVHECGEGER